MNTKSSHIISPVYRLLLTVNWLSLLGIPSVLLLAVGLVLLLRWLSVNNLLRLGVNHLLLTILGRLGVDDLRLSVDNLRLLLLLLIAATDSTETATAADTSKATKATTECARAKQSLETHAWSELLSKSALLELILQGKSTEGWRSEYWLLINWSHFLFFLSLRSLWNLRCFNVADLTANFDAAWSLVFGTLSLKLAANFEFMTGLNFMVLFEITADFDLAAILSLSAGLELVVKLSFVLKRLKFVANLEFGSIAVLAVLVITIESTIRILLLAIATIRILLLAIATLAASSVCDRAEIVS